MSEMFDSDEIIIHWVENIPVADLKPVLAKMQPPGDWVLYAHYQKVIDQAMARLETLHGESMRGRLCVVISRTLDQIALVELPSQQRELNLGLKQDANQDLVPEIAAVEEGAIVGNGQEAPQPAPSSEVIAQAIAVSEDLLAKNDAGEYVTAEDYLNALRASPDPKLTANALRISGAGGAVHGVSVSFNPGAHQRFPELIESGQRFRMRFADCTDVGPHEVKADFKREHMPGQNVDSGVGQLMKFRQRLPISLAGSPDATLFRVGAAAELELDAEVTVTVSTFERAIKRLTLVRLTDREETLGQLDQFMGQLRLPLCDKSPQG